MLVFVGAAVTTIYGEQIASEKFIGLLTRSR